jgi:hypothetical protein
MPSSEQTEALAGPIRAIQIICAAISVGPLIFMFIVLFAIPGGMAGTLGPPMITYVAILFALIVLAVRGPIMNRFVSRERKLIARGEYSTADGRMANDFIGKTGDAGRLLVVYQKRMIFSAALLEGSTFFLIIAYMIERTPYALAGAILLLLALLAQIPSRAGIERWIEEQYQILAQDRQGPPAQP